SRGEGLAERTRRPFGRLTLTRPARPMAADEESAAAPAGTQTFANCRGADRGGGRRGGIAGCLTACWGGGARPGLARHRRLWCLAPAHPSLRDDAAIDCLGRDRGGLTREVHRARWAPVRSRRAAGLVCRRAADDNRAAPCRRAPIASNSDSPRHAFSG